MVWGTGWGSRPHTSGDDAPAATHSGLRGRSNGPVGVPFVVRIVESTVASPLPSNGDQVNEEVKSAGGPRVRWRSGANRQNGAVTRTPPDSLPTELARKMFQEHLDELRRRDPSRCPHHWKRSALGHKRCSTATWRGRVRHRERRPDRRPDAFSRGSLLLVVGAPATVGTTTFASSSPSQRRAQLERRGSHGERRETTRVSTASARLECGIIDRMGAGEAFRRGGDRRVRRRGSHLGGRSGRHGRPGWTRLTKSLFPPHPFERHSGDGPPCSSRCRWRCSGRHYEANRRPAVTIAGGWASW